MGIEQNDISNSQPEAMEVDDGAEPDVSYLAEKIKIVAGDPNDLTAATFQFTDEDHTLGNSLRWVVAKDPDVEYVGYSIPHPSEPKMNFRVQTINGKEAVKALNDGLDNLIEMCQHVSDAFQLDFKRAAFKVLPDEREQVNLRVAEALKAKRAQSS